MFLSNLKNKNYLNFLKLEVFIYENSETLKDFFLGLFVGSFVFFCFFVRFNFVETEIICNHESDSLVDAELPDYYIIIMRIYVIALSALLGMKLRELDIRVFSLRTFDLVFKKILISCNINKEKKKLSVQSCFLCFSFYFFIFPFMAIWLCLHVSSVNVVCFLLFIR
jgi:hypothetical protein